MISIAVIIILSYLAGSLPTSILAGKILKDIDIREHGSGNAGATNVFRVLGWKTALVVGIIDLFKGFAATIFISGIAFSNVPMSQELVRIIAGISAIVGHIWTVFAGFKGGKGVLTTAHWPWVTSVAASKNGCVMMMRCCGYSHCMARSTPA